MKDNENDDIIIEKEVPYQVNSWNDKPNDSILKRKVAILGDIRATRNSKYIFATVEKIYLY